MLTWSLLLPIVLLLAVGFLVLLIGGIVWAVRQATTPAAARAQFRQEREHLEARFFQVAANSGKPRGLRWTACEWDDPVLLARDTRTGQLLALVGVTISFEAIEGGDMEGLPAVGNLRNATAVFVYERGHWHTAGRVVFNLNPDEALRHFGERYEALEP